MPNGWTVYDTPLASRFLLGTAGYPSPQVLRDAITAAGTQVVTLGLRRLNIGSGGDATEFVRIVRSSGARLLPNTAGCCTAREAIALAHMARELHGTRWIKLEVVGDEHTLQPDPWELLIAATRLVRDGFEVFPYCTDDLVSCQRLLDAGCRALMPWAAPIGSGQGLLNTWALRTLRARLPGVTLIVDAGLGAPSHAEVFDKAHAFLPHAELLSFEEITRLARLFALHGVTKLRITGGEPLLRRNLEILIAQLAELRTPQGEPLDLTLTTNGSLLARKAQQLKDAGLKRVTVSLDGLDDAVFRRMNDVDFPVADVLHGIEAAIATGLAPVKVNMVVRRGTNDAEIVPMARHFREHYGGKVVLRFIEFMDVGATNGWRMDDVLPSAQVIERIDAQFPLRALDATAPGETAQRWAYADGGGEIGVISSVTQAFCGDCNRARLSTEGKLYLCLFANQGHDLRALLRDPAIDDAQVAAAIGAIWSHRDDRYSELRGSAIAVPRARVEMSYIGG